MRAAGYIALGMVGIAVSVCSSAAAEPNGVDVVRAATGLGVDGVGHVAWGDSADGFGRVVVLDDKTLSKATVDLGRPCDRTSVIGGHRRRFLVTCAVDRTFSELVLDLRDGSVTTVLSDRDVSSLGDFYIRIGDNWLEGV